MSERTITLRVEDSYHERARKIFRLLGFVNDRLNLAPAMAEYLEAYARLDAAASALPNPPKDET